MNKIINEIGHAWWATTTEEMVKAHIFFDSLKQEFVDINSKAEFVIKKQQDILHFDWLDDTLFDKWMVDIAFDEKLQEAESDDDETHEDEL